jgi:OFA family oxalate/formate antiporter-like MFS transporter
MNRWRVIAGGISANLAFGSLYAWSVFVLPLEKEFGWTRAQTSWVYTIAVLVTVSATVIGGRLQDRRGPRAAVLLGGALLACGYFISSVTSSLAVLYLGFGLFAGFGGGCGYAAPLPVASKWFPDNRGLVVGLMAGGYAAASAITAPLAEILISAYGWRTAFRVLGMLFLIMAGVGAALLQNPPAGYDRQPAGSRGGSPIPAGMSTATMLRVPAFWALWGAFCLGSWSGQTVISQLVPFAKGAGLGVLAVSLAIPIAAIGNVSGRVVSGWLSDRAGRLTTLRTMMLASAIVMPMLYFWRQNTMLFFIFVVAVYWCYGTQMSVFGSTLADFYGTDHLGMNWGVLLTGWGVAGMAGPVMAGWFFDRFHSYRDAFMIAALLAVAATALLALARVAPQDDLVRHAT